VPATRGFIDEERSAAKKIILGEIAASFPQREFFIVVLALREKYGEPSKTESAIKQNGAGASFTDESLVWLIGEDRIEAVERYTRVDRSLVRIKRPAVTETANGIFTESTKKAAADL
jgi:nicotinic acid mononucleotide adenylyltransferase